MKITILEDQSQSLTLLKKYLSEWSEQNNLILDIETYKSGEEYFNHNPNISSNNSSVYFLDIQMGKMNGIDVAKRLRLESYNGPIIFLTAFREYVFKGYDVHAMNYLLKPVQKEALFLCLDEIATSLSGNAYLYRDKQDIVRIPYNEIITFSSCFHYVDILTENGNFCQYSSLNQIISRLPKEFIRVHRSCIVNMNHILKISGSTIVLSNRMKVNIGRTYLKNAIESFIQYSTRLN